MDDFFCKDALKVDIEYFGAFVGMRIKEITVKEWEKINGRRYTLSGDPTRGVFGVRLRWNYHHITDIIPFNEDLTESDAKDFVDNFNSRINLT